MKVQNCGKIVIGIPIILLLLFSCDNLNPDYATENVNLIISPDPNVSKIDQTKVKSFTIIPESKYKVIGVAEEWYATYTTNGTEPAQPIPNSVGTLKFEFPKNKSKEEIEIKWEKGLEDVTYKFKIRGISSLRDITTQKTVVFKYDTVIINNSADEIFEVPLNKCAYYSDIFTSIYGGSKSIAILRAKSNGYFNVKAQLSNISSFKIEKIASGNSTEVVSSAVSEVNIPVNINDEIKITIWQGSSYTIGVTSSTPPDIEVWARLLQ